jgi:hypothetical protein
LPGWFSSPDHFANLVIAENNGLLSGMEGFGPEWNPWAPASRSEAARILYNLILLQMTDADLAAATDLGEGRQRGVVLVDSVWDAASGRLRFDPVQFLTGAEAIQAAEEDGWTVDNDYYVRNQNSRLYNFSVAPAATVKVSTTADAWEEMTWPEFTAWWQENPWVVLFWLEWQGSQVTLIEQQWVP